MLARAYKLIARDNEILSRYWHQFRVRNSPIYPTDTLSIEIKPPDFKIKKVICLHESTVRSKRTKY